MITAEKTRRVTLKAIPTGHLLLAHPSAKPGGRIVDGGTRRGRAALIYAIDGVPESVSNAELVRRANETVFFPLPSTPDGTWPADALTYDFADLGPGRIAKSRLERQGH